MAYEMPWIRRYRRSGAWVALFALALQLVLSFGHVHVDSAAGSIPAFAGISASQAADVDGTPSDSDHHPGTHDFCAICATIGLASSLLLPQPAQLKLPIADAHKWPREYQAALVARQPHFLFQARAPPVLS
jgi:hypothetical protein